MKFIIFGNSNFFYVSGAGDDVAADNEYVAGYCMDQKIDLSSYIKWWGASKARQPDSYVKGTTSEETKHGCSEDTGNEASELTVQSTEPYEMPRLGLSQKGKSHKSSTTSAMSILSQCAAYKNLQEKVSKKKEKVENDENENKNAINKIDYGKTIEKSIHDAGTERLGPLFGTSVGLTINRNIHPLTPILSAPLLTNYNSIDALTDPVLWTSLVPVFPPGSSRATEVGC